MESYGVAPQVDETGDGGETVGTISSLECNEVPGPDSSWPTCTSLLMKRKSAEPHVGR